MRELTVETAGAELAVRISRPDGEPLLLLHGGPGVPDSMQADIAPLLPTYRAISFDQRGVGRSRCRDGLYQIDDYLADIEAIREQLEISTWHVLGHSWGGLLAQLYAAHHGPRVRSLVLSSSSLGVGADWKATKRDSFRIELGRAGAGGTLRLYLYGSLLFPPNPFRRWAMRHVMTETWHNYFLDPGTAPEPDREWLDGCCPTALLRTDRSLSRAAEDELAALRDYTGPVLVLYGADDIFGESVATVRGRFPEATQVILGGSGHLHWLQNQAGYQEALRSFYAAM
ncbi:MAG: alpha/beta hydrolase [Candidatus Dormibacteria bacterium]|jgi:proline iminopeptidase